SRSRLEQSATPTRAQPATARQPQWPGSAEPITRSYLPQPTCLTLHGDQPVEILRDSRARSLASRTDAKPTGSAAATAAGFRLGARSRANSAGDFLNVTNRWALLQGRGHASLLPSDHVEANRLALGDREGVAALDLEAVSAQIRKHTIAVAAQLNQGLE